MKAAYVVTLFRGYNYGSALQCYSLQQVIKKFNTKPYVIDVHYEGLNWSVRRLTYNLRYHISCQRFQERKVAFQGIVENAKTANSAISDSTKEKFNRFIDEKISVKYCRYDELNRIAKSEECVACISGSDQVWGTSVKYLNPIHFLTFAPKTKRYSYAASFGSGTIPEWFVNDITRYLRSYRRISVREDNALKILDDIGIKNGEVMVDPTLLLTAEEWTQIEKRPEGIKDDFELMYFLNTPSSIAENHIGRMRERNQKGTVYYSPFNNIHCEGKSIETISLSPEEFVWTIHHCKRLYTDSFHGVVFAVLFHKDFYVYQREYVGVADQSSRIRSILLHLNLSNQFITDIKTDTSPDYSLSDSILAKDREKSYSYLGEILKN